MAGGGKGSATYHTSMATRAKHEARGDDARHFRQQQRAERLAKAGGVRAVQAGAAGVGGRGRALRAAAPHSKHTVLAMKTQAAADAIQHNVASSPKYSAKQKANDFVMATVTGHVLTHRGFNEHADALRRAQQSSASTKAVSSRRAETRAASVAPAPKARAAKTVAATPKAKAATAPARRAAAKSSSASSGGVTVHRITV